MNSFAYGIREGGTEKVLFELDFEGSFEGIV